MSKETSRKKMISLMLGKTGEMWDPKQVQVQALRRLRDIQNFRNVKDVVFLVQMLGEIIEQAPETFDFRLVGEFYQPKMRELRDQDAQNYIEQCRKHWVELCKKKKFGIQFDFGFVQPCAFNDEDEVGLAHKVDPSKVDMIRSIPRSDDKTLKEWQAELNASPDTEITMLSLKEAKWRFGLYSVATRENPGTSLQADLRNRIVARAFEMGGLPKSLVLEKQPLQLISNVFNADFIPSYRIELNKDWRRKIIEQVQKKLEQSD